MNRHRPEGDESATSSAVRITSQADLRQRLGQLLSDRTVIVCMGSELHGDDGVGVVVGRALAESVRWTVFEVSIAPESFVVKIANCRPDRVILIDSVDVGAPAGMIALVDVNALVGASPSTHGPATKLFLEALRLMHLCPFAVLGVQPAGMETGRGLTTPVAKAAHRNVAAFRALSAACDDRPPAPPTTRSGSHDRSCQSPHRR